MKERCHDGRPVRSCSISWGPDPTRRGEGYTSLVVTHSHGRGERIYIDTYTLLTVGEAQDVIEQALTGYAPGAMHEHQGTLW